jgi:hypothetical protein
MAVAHWGIEAEQAQPREGLSVFPAVWYQTMRIVSVSVGRTAYGCLFCEKNSNGARTWRQRGSGGSFVDAIFLFLPELESPFTEKLRVARLLQSAEAATLTPSAGLRNLSAYADYRDLVELRVEARKLDSVEYLPLLSVRSRT